MDSYMQSKLDAMRLLKVDMITRIRRLLADLANDARNSEARERNESTDESNAMVVVSKFDNIAEILGKLTVSINVIKHLMVSINVKSIANFKLMPVRYLWIIQRLLNSTVHFKSYTFFRKAKMQTALIGNRS